MNINEMLSIANPLQGMADLTGYSANQLNKQQFREQMNFAKEQWNTQVQMANSAHQREMADLKAAGINPILTGMGGQGAGTAQGVHMPGIPDNTATQKGMGAILNAVMTIAPQIAQMKNANSAMISARAADKVAGAQSTKLLAEAGKLATEKDINNFIKTIKKYESENYSRYYEAQISKSPLWIKEQLENMFNLGSNSAMAKSFENLGGQMFDLLNTKEKPKNNWNYSKGEKLVGLFLQLMGAL